MVPPACAGHHPNTRIVWVTGAEFAVPDRDVETPPRGAQAADTWSPEDAPAADAVAPGSGAAVALPVGAAADAVAPSGAPGSGAAVAPVGGSEASLAPVAVSDVVAPASLDASASASAAEASLVPASLADDPFEIPIAAAVVAKRPAAAPTGCNRQFVILIKGVQRTYAHTMPHPTSTRTHVHIPRFDNPVVGCNLYSSHAEAAGGRS